LSQFLLCSQEVCKFRLTFLLTLVLITTMLQSCSNVYTPVSINVVTSVDVMNEHPTGGPGGFAFIVGGVGTCKELKIDWGDGNVEHIYDFDSTQKTPIFHSFEGWASGRTITVFGVTGCEGTARTKFYSAPGKIYKIGLMSWTHATCITVPNQPLLAGRTFIHITTVPAKSYPYGIDFGCPSDSCIYDANGKPDSSAPSRFPFPGFREFSLIIRVGTEIFQGGTDVHITSTQNAPLELCINDDNLANNYGGYTIQIETNQIGPE
jgi:hypothetical protein